MKNTITTLLFLLIALAATLPACQKEDCSELAAITIAAFEEYQLDPDSVNCSQALAAFQFYSENCESTERIQRAIDSVICPE